MIFLYNNIDIYDIIICRSVYPKEDQFSGAVV